MDKSVVGSDLQTRDVLTQDMFQKLTQYAQSEVAGKFELCHR
jgi:hypothetical protein